jgi:hypothetical protein
MESSEDDGRSCFDYIVASVTAMTYCLGSRRKLTTSLEGRVDVFYRLHSRKAMWGCGPHYHFLSTDFDFVVQSFVCGSCYTCISFVILRGYKKEGRDNKTATTVLKVSICLCAHKPNIETRPEFDSGVLYDLNRAITLNLSLNKSISGKRATGT